jgi:hypothetical protein
LRSAQQLVLQIEVHVGSSVRRALSETAISIAAFGVLALALAASDSRVRDRVATHLSSRPTAELASAGALVKDVVMIVFQAARDQSLAHAPLVMFVVAGSALLLFMLRT